MPNGTVFSSTPDRSLAIPAWEHFLPILIRQVLKNNEVAVVSAANRTIPPVPPPTVSSQTQKSNVQFNRVEHLFGILTSEFRVFYLYLFFIYLFFMRSGF